MKLINESRNGSGEKLCLNCLKKSSFFEVSTFVFGKSMFLVFTILVISLIIPLERDLCNLIVVRGGKL